MSEITVTFTAEEMLASHADMVARAALSGVRAWHDLGYCDCRDGVHIMGSFRAVP